jgi:serine-type D-Ala-D-Ala endopeptidase (penicillin-binding protein 7)
MRLVLVLTLLGVLGRPTSASDLPAVKSQSVVVLDAKTGEELFSKDADEVRGIASTTKIFVAMVVRKKGIDLDGWTEITKTDVQAARGGARTRLDIRRKFRNRDLLRAMLVASDNRAPTALGRAVGLDQDQLIAAMNQLAKDLGLKQTRFTCSSGLRGNVSTAREMAVALRVALRDKVLRDIMATSFQTVVSQDRRAKIAYTSTNAPLVAKRYDVIGGKTGYTKVAGYCYVTAARFMGREVLLAFLGAKAKSTRFEDFYRVASWLAKGAPGRVAKSKQPPAKRVASP